MSRTHKDKRSIYREESEMLYSSRSEPGLKQRFINFKKSGPPLDGEQCPECGGLTDFHSGYLTCCECGWTEGVVDMYDLERFSA
ncbi:MAG: hypothetical protein JNL11_16975 [Bdellovibrionaceae bacterium]|nr:hypothetical protein [Pseudobdellovibrionaceae bacterium]